MPKLEIIQEIVETSLKGKLHNCIVILAMFLKDGR